ncbi:hypothetical protein K6U06_18945 [Acidiferrimicrobium sp. IK]|uniref:hypothetical protein n=1 Tax=Acidiferrimicrobium sp. IK TaxID=2871700 RepID=UPI0021CAFEEF|nr:hypothetical protein [Acidiferrimicrobium sp. IK]MCU4186453.1 hypothetical protein [Acidiferrimicrobium sp. IK]
MAGTGFGSFGIPNPLNLIPGLLGGGGGGGVLGGLLGGLGGIIQGWIASAVTSAVDELEKLVNNSAGSISFSGGSWWGTKVTGSGQLWATVTSIALAVLLGCLILAVIRGALAGEPMTMLRAAAVEVPKSIFGMATVVALTGVLSGIVDSASTAVLPSVGANFGSWFSKADPAGFFGSFVELLVLLGALLTWVELVVRQGLVFLLVALSPMVLAARVWPAAAGVWRRLVELGVALIVSKFVIALALALGSDALAGSVTQGHGASLTAMTTGAGLMLLASLSPFVLLRMLPGVEAAVAAQGISRMPARTAMTAVSTATSVMLLGRLGAAAGGGKAIAATGSGGGRASGGEQTERMPAASSSLARAAALDVGSRPAPIPGRGARGLPPGPKALPPAPGGGNRGGGEGA